MALQQRKFVYSFLSVVFALFGSCGGDEKAEPSYAPPPVFGAADPSMTCQPGYVGWNFATGGGIEALPKPMKIVSLDCDGMGNPKTPAVAGQGVVSQCTSATSCNFVEVCKTISVKFTCGDDKTQYEREFPGGRGSLSCYFAGNDKVGASDATSSAGKTCVPKTCPNNTFRDEKLNCVTAAKHHPKFFAFGPPTAIALQRTSANQNKERLVGDTEYLFVSSMSVGAGQSDNGTFWDMFFGNALPEGRLEFWFADEYVAKDPNSGLAPVQGYRCLAAQAYVSPTSIIKDWIPYVSVPPGGMVWVASRTVISPQCTADPAVQAAQRDAARRAAMSLDDFKNKYTLKQLRLHSSFDMEGQNVLPDAVEQAAVPQSAQGCLPRPPGFFYHVGADPKDSYIDMMAYYRQRELTGYYVNGRDYSYVQNAFGSYFNSIKSTQTGNGDFAVTDGSGREFGTRSSEFPTRIRIGAKSMMLNSPEVEIAKYGDVQPRIDVTVEHKIAGGTNLSNPYGFKGPTVAGAKGLKARQLSADVYLHPATAAAFDASTAVKIGSVPLGDGVPTGTMTNGTVSISKRNRRRFFDDWAGIDNFKVFYCIGADGLQTLGSAQNLDLPVITNAGIDYSAGVDPDDSLGGKVTIYRCAAADTVMVVHRDESRRPLNPAAVSANEESANDASTGDSNSKGSQGTQGEKSCSGSRCTITRHADMGVLGNFGSTIFDSSSTTTEEDSDDDSGNVAMGAQAEALGFTILDMPSDGTHEWADSVDHPANMFSFALSPNWGGIEAAIDKALTGTEVEAEQGRYAGRDGLGIAFGYKTMVAGPIPGQVNVGVSAGVGMALEFKVTTKPEQDYPCEKDAGSTEKCYLVLEDDFTQEDARGECAKLGGYLAEVRTDDELDHLKTLLADVNGRVWLGGQQAYQYVGGSCAEAADQTCAQNAKLSYRWLSDDQLFATATGNGAVAFNAATTLESGDVSFVSQLPKDETAVAFQTSDKKLVLRATNEKLRGVCEFEPAKDWSYLRFEGGLSLGVGAGVGISYCTPDEDFGICLEGSVNFVALGLSFGGANEMFTVVRSRDGKKNKIGGSGTDVPWKLLILSGAIVAKFNFYIASAEFTIVSWDGFTAAQGSLFDTYNAVVEKGR